jgi:hypothetical protein
MRRLTAALLVLALGVSPRLEAGAPILETPAPAIAPRDHPPIRDFFGPPSPKGDALEPLSWIREVRLSSPPHSPSLVVSPQVGLAPLAVTITLRLASPRADDRELEITAWDAGDDDMVAPLFRSTRDVQWPEDKQPQPQTLRAHWRLPQGSLLVVGCVWPRAGCVAQRVVVA